MSHFTLPCKIVNDNFALFRGPVWMNNHYHWHVQFTLVSKTHTFLCLPFNPFENSINYFKFIGGFVVERDIWLPHEFYIVGTPWNTVQGGLIPEMIQVCDYDKLIVLVELNTLLYVRPLNDWQILELGHFEVGNFAKNWHF